MFFIILGIIASLILFMTYPRKSVAVIPLVVALLLASVKIIPLGHTAIVTTFGKMEDKILYSGINFIAPYQSATVVDNRTQKQQITTQAFSSDIQQVDALVTVNFRVAPESEQTLLVYALVTNERNTYHNLEENQAAIDESLIIIGLLHDLCKTNFYQQSTRNVKNKQTGQWEEVPYYSIEDTLPMGHGEKSLYMIQGFIKLTRDEAMAIRWHMGFSDAAVKGGDYSLNQAFEKYPLAVLAHAADFMASNLDETKGV